MVIILGLGCVAVGDELVGQLAVGFGIGVVGCVCGDWFGCD